jgi:addiction module HigA family antidote
MLVAIHPGEYVTEALEELGISQSAFADTIGVSLMRISHVINGSRPVTAELALLLSKAFGQLNSQPPHLGFAAFDLLFPRIRWYKRITARDPKTVHPSSFLQS